MADSVSTEAWLDQRRWAALEEALKAQGSNVKRHLQDYLITLYNETVPLERWVQIETAITKEELESAQAAEDQKVYAAFHIRENGHDSIFSTGNGEEFLDVAIRLRRYLQGDAEAVKGGFSHHFYKTQPITRERFDELAALRLENTGKVSGAFEIDLDAGWCSALNLADGWQTFKNKDVSTAAYALWNSCGCNSISKGCDTGWNGMGTSNTRHTAVAGLDPSGRNRSYPSSRARKGESCDGGKRPADKRQRPPNPG